MACVYKTFFLGFVVVLAVVRVHGAPFPGCVGGTLVGCPGTPNCTVESVRARCRKGRTRTLMLTSVMLYRSLKNPSMLLLMCSHTSHATADLGNAADNPEH